MNMFIRGHTSLPDLAIDFIEVQFSNGVETAVTWRASSTAVEGGKFSGYYDTLLVGEDDIDADNPQVRILFDEKMRITTIGLHSETESPKLDVDDIFLLGDAINIHFPKPSVSN